MSMNSPGGERDEEVSGQSLVQDRLGGVIYAHRVVTLELLARIQLAEQVQHQALCMGPKCFC